MHKSTNRPLQNISQRIIIKTKKKVISTKKKNVEQKSYT